METKDLTFIVVDVETTGLSPDQNELIEIGLVKVKNLEIVDQFSSLIKPLNPVPPYVKQLTGLNDELLSTAPFFKDISDSILGYIEPDSIFVGHNVAFDFNMLNAAFWRIGIANLDMPTLDTQFIASLFYPTLSSLKLSRLAEALEIKPVKMHRAVNDALITAEILIKCCNKLDTLPLELLHEINKILIQDNNPWPLKDVLLTLEKQRPGWSDLPPQTGWKEFLRHKLLSSPKKSQGSTVFVPINEKELVECLDNSVEIDKAFQNYENRPQQKEMLTLVCQALNDFNHLVIEAGTGTGKSLAYLLPAAALAIANHSPVVISTKTKNLQDQLLDKDIPIVETILQKQLDTVLLKGRENYLCLRKFDLLIRGSNSKKLIPLLVWLYYTTDGDMSEIHNSIIWSYQHNLKSQSSTCLGTKCPYRKYCFPHNLRKKAVHADLVIVNHSLLFIDANSDGFLLPEYKSLILDEAHTIEDVATNSFSREISGHIINEALSRITPPVLQIEKIKEIQEVCKQAAHDFDRALRVFARSHPQDKIIFVEANCRGSQWQKILQTKDDLLSILTNFQSTLQAIDLDNDNLMAELKGTITDLDNFVDTLFFVFKPESNYLSWLEADYPRKPNEVKIVSSPKQVQELLDKSLFSQKQSVILTSATLTVNNNFDFFIGRVGLDLNPEKTVVDATLGSPFDYQKQSLLCIPRDLPEPGDTKNFVPAIANYLKRLLKITQGKTLVLFTSYEMLIETYNLLVKENLNFTLLCQNKNTSRKHLLDSFQNDTNSVLLGTDSFWEGVDVPGISLSCVVIVKLPFFVPTDPLVMARTEEIRDKGGNGFYKYAIPHAVMKFKQGFGRLIRTKSDRGIVVILDNRLLTKNYGSMFLRSIPESEHVFGPADATLKKIGEWLA